MWEALNDPETLARCIPGCEELARTGANEFTAKVRAKVGPVSAAFAGTVTLSDIDPPAGYVISGEGKGGAAGFARGSARVSLAEEDGATVLSYEADARVGGRLAQLGARLIGGTVSKYADDFFGALAGQLADGDGAPATAAAPAGAQPAGTAPPVRWRRVLAAVLLGAVLAGALLLLA